MYLIEVAAEMTPIAKVGGLGDVLLGISREWIQRGHQVEVFLPKYAQLREDLCDHLSPAKQSFSLFHRNCQVPIFTWKASFGCIPVRFFSAPSLSFFERKRIYGYSDDCERFLFFCKMVYEWLALHTKHGFPDLLHLHDWHTAFLAKKCRALSRPLKIALTLHNLQHQGILPSELVPDYFPEEPPCENLLRVGIESADCVTTVSPTYAREVLFTDRGQGLQGLLQSKGDRFCGILNGIDSVFWNPQTDPFLIQNYSAHHPEKLLEKKDASKQEIQKILGLKEEQALPLFVCITRLDAQKGIELIEKALFFFSEREDAQCVLLGESCLDQERDPFPGLKRRWKDHPFVSIQLGREEELAHKLYAAANFFFVPSQFEPCGLTQMIALRFGALPIVRHTGGLADTICDLGREDARGEEKNGFVFAASDWEEFRSTLLRALRLWVERPEEWVGYAHRGMQRDFSWRSSIKQYEELFQRELSG